MYTTETDTMYGECNSTVATMDITIASRYYVTAMKHLTRMLYCIGEDRRYMTHYRWQGYDNGAFIFKDTRDNTIIEVYAYGNLRIATRFAS